MKLELYLNCQILLQTKEGRTPSARGPHGPLTSTVIKRRRGPGPEIENFDTDGSEVGSEREFELRK